MHEWVKICFDAYWITFSQIGTFNVEWMCEYALTDHFEMFQEVIMRELVSV